jgi:deoxyuridine 5'-triphosphate nucleotidohydrolase
MLRPEFKFCLNDDLEKNCQKYNKSVKNRSDWLKVEDFIPATATPTDAGLDVRCAEPSGMLLSANTYFKMSLGFRVFTPPGWWLHVVPRSSTFTKKYIINLYGVIDQAYEGNCFFCGVYIPNFYAPRTRVVEFGERIAQIIPLERHEMQCSAVSNEEFKRLCEERGGQRGEGGFGSTG